ncbi:MAG TPA: PDZ domain-containing protein, partial [Brevundimonas sp.]|nr:PDZ domain-containing protein [Brevundimonas sp.]
GGLNFRVGLHAPNETVQVGVLRDGRRETLNARISPLPGDPDTDKATLIQQGGLSGAQVLVLNPALADSLGGDPFLTGVIVGRVDGRGYARRGVGLMSGDVILSINDRPVTAVSQLANVPRGAQLAVERRGQRGILVVR